MKTSLKALGFALAAGLPMLATSASADPMGEKYTGYISIGGGVNFHQGGDATLLYPAPLGAAALDLDYKMGKAAGGSVGFYLGPSWRVEIEGVYRSNAVNPSPFIVGVTPNLPAGLASSASGRLRGWATLVNVLYDFDLGGNVTPYVGGGVGFGNYGLKLACAAPAPCTIEAKDNNALAYQGIAGVAFTVSDRVQFFTDYKYFNTSKLDIGGGAGIAPVVRNLENHNHTIMGGIRVSLWSKEKPVVAPPPAVVAPTPKNYLVFFDFDQSKLTSDAAQIVSTAAQDAMSGKATRIDITGHADRSGSDQYNIGLSERRADTVKAELVRLGIPESAISVTWKGESEPLVPTEDGVREPQNRRASIVISYPSAPGAPSANR